MQRVLSQVLKEAGYSQDSYLTLDDFIKVCTFCDIFALDNLKWISQNEFFNHS